MLKSAFLGCGPRAKGQARAYEYVKKAQIAAISDLSEERLTEFGEEYGVSARYTDVHEMLDKEKPDLLHIVTAPPLRANLMQIAVDHKVPGVTIEKPIAIQGEDYREVCAFLEDCPTKFIVNHQLRYHDRIIALKEAVLNGEIGEVRFIHGTSRLNVAGQGTHITDLMFAFNGESPPTRVFGHVAGGGALEGGHAGPEMAGGELIFENGVHGMLACGTHAPEITDQPGQHLHKRIAVYGTRGLVHWTMHGWEKCVDGKHESGDHSYYDVDHIGQANLTDALADWIEDDSKVHGNNLKTSLREYQLILGLYSSALRREPVELPFDPEDNMVAKLKEVLGG